MASCSPPADFPKSMKSRIVGVVVVGLVAAIFVLFFLQPVALTLRGAFVDADGRFTLDFLAEVFRNPVYVEGLRNALLVAVVSTALTVLIAVPLAVIAHRLDFPGKRLLGGLILVPMILPPFVGAIGVKQMLGQAGAVNALLIHLGMMDASAPIDWLGQGRFWGVVVMIALHLYPILYLNVLAALSNIDPAMEEAATNLGSPGWRRFLRVTLPLSAPGLFAGGIIVFIWSFTELGVPLMFDYNRVTAVQIFDGIKDLAGNPIPYALVAVMMISSVLLYVVAKVIFGRTDYATVSKAATSSSSRRASPLAGSLAICAFVGVGAIAILPHVGVVLVAFTRDWYGTVLPQGWTLEHFESALGHNLTVPSIANSLKYAGLSTFVDVILGVSIAWVVVRTKWVGRHLLDAMAMLPLAVPGLVLAFGYLAMTQEGRFFQFMSPTRDPTLLLVIAYAVRRLPYMVRAAVAGFQQTSVTLEEAAQNLGASPLRSLRRITLPLISANLIAGGMLAFSFAMLEVADSLLLAQKQQHYPISKAIYELFGLLGEGRFLASALGVWAMAFLGVTLVGAAVVLGKRLGALFRV